MRPKVLIPLALMAATGGLSGIGGAMGGLKGAALGKAATGTLAAGPMSYLPGAGAAFTPATTGWLGSAGKLALGKGTLAKGIMSGLTNPLSKKGLATYGGLAALGMGMLGDKGEKTEDPVDRKALNQANYNMMRMYGQNAGYTDEDINTIYGPLGEMMGGGHTEVPADPNQRVRRQFPGTNYPIYTTQGAANGGRIERPGYFLGGLLKGLTGGDPEDVEASDTDHYRPTKEQQDLLSQVQYLKGIGHEDPDEIIGLIGGGNLNEEDKAFLLERLIAPELKANGGRIGLSGGGGSEWGSYKDWLEGSGILEKYPELEGMTPDEQQNFLEGIGLLRANGGRIHKNIGGIMNAGSIPQTMQNPVDMNMQLDGRGGGFIPMGAKPKADDVPAMLSKDEFVMTRDAVKAMGDGDTNIGAQRMYDLMNNLEAKVV